MRDAPATDRQSRALRAAARAYGWDRLVLLCWTYVVIGRHPELITREEAMTLRRDLHRYAEALR